VLGIQNSNHSVVSLVPKTGFRDPGITNFLIISDPGVEIAMTRVIDDEAWL